MTSVRRTTTAVLFATIAMAALPRPGGAQTPYGKPRPDARFGNWLFKTPDPAVWSRQEKEGHLLFTAAGGGRWDYCVLTLYPGGPTEGEFKQQFADTVAEKLKNRGVGRLLADSGALPHRADEGFEVLTRTIRGETRRGEADHIYCAAHSGDRFDMAAFQASSPELFHQHEAEAARFLESLKLINAMSPDAVDRALAPDVPPPPPPVVSVAPPPAAPTWPPVVALPVYPSVPAPPPPPEDHWAWVQSRPDSKFGNWLFVTPATATWSRQVKEDHLLFTARAGRREYCVLTLFPGDRAADDFKQQFAEAVGWHLKNRGVFRIIADSGPLPHRAPDGFDVLVRVVRGQGPEGEVEHVYAAARSGGRFDLASYQASNPELFRAHEEDAKTFLQSLRVVNALTPDQVDRLLNR